MHRFIDVRRLTVSVPALVFCLAFATSSWPAQSQVPYADNIDRQFRYWLIETVWPDALQQGVSRATFDEAMARVTPDRSLPELQLPGTSTPPNDQRQAEFQSPGRYFSESQITSLARTGANLLQQW